ncbi:MAG: YfiR family protein [Sphingobacteriia bacterium]|nr:YfiR family protein [Sphingobacteriia bacterium]
MKGIFNIGWLILILFLLITKRDATAQLKGSPENIMGSFIFNFTEYIAWSETSSENQFKILVLGESPVINSLQYIAGVREVKGKKLVVKKISKTSEIEICQIIYVSKEFDEILGEISKNPKLCQSVIVTNCEGCLQNGTSINFINEKDKIRFEINKTELDQKSIKISSQLLKLAAKVI